jgi:hypothetical protein
MRLRLPILALLTIYFTLALAPFVVGLLAHAPVTPLGVFNYLLVAFKLTLAGLGLAVYFFTSRRDEDTVY